MQSYLDEYVFRFNRRKSAQRGLLFYRLIESAMQTKTITYDELVNLPYLAAMLVKRVGKFIISLLTIVFFQSYGATIMENNEYNTLLGQMLLAFCKEYKCEESLKAEKRDGLIMIDFRKINSPPFADKWPYSVWNFSKLKKEGWECFYFRWGVWGNHGKLEITAKVCDSYELARKEFLLMPLSSSMFPLPWVVCPQKIGTACAEDDGKITLFFLYKNVTVRIDVLEFIPGHEDFAEEMAEWLFNVLKKHPLTPMLPPCPLTLAKPGYPVSKQGYWKIFIPPELAPKEAPLLNADAPHYKYPGDELNALGYVGHPVWDNLVWIWIGENYPDQQAVLQAGKIAVERYDRERRNPPE